MSDPTSVRACTQLTGDTADLILMHTDAAWISLDSHVRSRELMCHQDVPSNYLEQLSKIWKLQSIDYIDGVPALYTTKGTRFDGVFTKLSVTWPKFGLRSVCAPLGPKAQHAKKSHRESRAVFVCFPPA